MRPITTVRAGMLTPSASVSVAKTTCIRPLPNSDLDQLLQDRQQAGVVESDPGLRASRCDQLDLVKLAVFRAAAHPGSARSTASIRRCSVSADQVRPHLGQSLGECLAVVPAEEEVDRRQHIVRRQRVDDLVRLRLVRAGIVALIRGCAGPRRFGSSVALPPPVCGKSRNQLPRVIDDFMQLFVDEVVEGKRHGPLDRG